MKIGWIILMIIALFILQTIIGVWLWGAIAVGVFGLPALTFWKFVGLEILLWLLIPTRPTRVDTNSKRRER